MEISCTQEKLNKGLSLVNKVVGFKTTLPILNNALLETDKGRLKLSSTDLEIGINVWIGAKIEKNGKITVPCRILSDFIASLDDKKINLKVKESILYLESEKYHTKLQGAPADEFPLIPEIKEKPMYSFSGKILEEALPQVIPASSIDESRPVLSGICFKFQENCLKIAATDSYRLAEKTIPIEKKIKTPQTAIVPLKTCQELIRILSSISCENVKITVAENQIRFQINQDIEIVSRLIEGNFPNYEQIIPTSFQTQTEVDLASLQNALKIANLFAQKGTNSVKLKFNQSQGITILAEAAQVGTTDSKVSAKIKGTDSEITFNARFVLDGLSAIKRGKINFDISGKYNPALIKPLNSKDYFYVIMPLRTEG